MSLKVIENIWGEKFEIASRGGFFTKELIAITLIAVLVIVEVPIILLILKKIAPSDFNFILFILAFVVILLGVFILVFLASPPKLIFIKASKEKGEIELGWRRNLILRTQQTIAIHLVNKILITVFSIKSKKRIRMEIEKLNGENIIATFSYEPSDFNEKVNCQLKLDTVLLNLGKIVGFESYTAKRGISVYELSFTKATKGRALIDDSQRELKFEENHREQNIRDIKIPDLIIREISDGKISLYKKTNFYDILRLFFILVIFPALFIIAYLSKDPKSYIPVAVILIVYIFLLYLMRRFISPIEVTIDRLRGSIKIKKLFFSYSFPISQIHQIELSDQVSKRTGTFIFHVNARFKNGRVHQLFYTEFSDRKEKKYEIHENIMLLLKIIQSQFNIEITDKTKHIL